MDCKFVINDIVGYEVNSITLRAKWKTHEENMII